MSQRTILSFDIGIKNLAVCVLGGVFAEGKKTKAKDTRATDAQESLQVWEWKLMPLVCEGENCKRMRVDTLSQRIFAAMRDLLRSLEERGSPPISHVLIENQPSRINGSMKSIQMIIYSFFQYMRFLGQHSIKEVVLVNARLKLQDQSGRDTAGGGVGAGTEQTLLVPLAAPAKRSSNYKKNKDDSVKLVRGFVAGDEYLRNHLAAHKKQDDLCDAMLQGMAWLKKNGMTGAVEHVVWAGAGADEGDGGWIWNAENDIRVKFNVGVEAEEEVF